MTIKYLNELEDLNYQAVGLTLGNRPLNIGEIVNMEQQYNNSNPFPDVLRELLYIAGRGCPLINLNPSDLQQKIRGGLYEHRHITSRPFIGFDYRDGSSFSLVYTDENTHDPKVYHVELEHSEDTHTEFLENSGFTLLRLIKMRINEVKQGYNPY